LTGYSWNVRLVTWIKLKLGNDFLDFFCSSKILSGLINGSLKIINFVCPTCSHKKYGLLHMWSDVIFSSTFSLKGRFFGRSHQGNFLGFDVSNLAKTCQSFLSFGLKISDSNIIRKIVFIFFLSKNLLISI
jgi:hypothetical protein